MRAIYKKIHLSFRKTSAVLLLTEKYNERTEHLYNCTRLESFSSMFLIRKEGARDLSRFLKI